MGQCFHKAGEPKPLLQAASQGNMCKVLPQYLAKSEISIEYNYCHIFLDFFPVCVCMCMCSHLYVCGGGRVGSLYLEI